MLDNCVCMCVFELVCGEMMTVGIGQLDHRTEHCLMLLLEHTNIMF